MPGPVLPAIVAGGAAAARGARNLYKAAKPFIRKEIKDFKRDMKRDFPGVLPASSAYVASDATDAATGRKISKGFKDNLKTLPDTIVRGSRSKPSNFSRKLIK